MAFDDEEEEERRPKERGIRTPPTGAGLLRFYEEEEGGFVKITPGWVVGITIVFLLTVILAWLRALGRLPI